MKFEKIFGICLGLILLNIVPSSLFPLFGFISIPIVIVILFILILFQLKSKSLIEKMFLLAFLISLHDIGIKFSSGDIQDRQGLAIVSLVSLFGLFIGLIISI